MDQVEQSTANYSALIINSNDFSEVTASIPLTLTATGSAAKTALMDSKRHFAAIFLNPILPHPGGLELIALAHRHRPATPVYLLYRDTPTFSPIEEQRLGIQAQLKMPLSAMAIRKQIDQTIFGYSFPVVDHPVFNVAAPEDGEYLAVSACDFLTGTASLFDVHVRLPSGRYFKILNALDILSPERALGYIQKGVSHFYIRKASQQRCLTYCDMMARFLISHSGVSMEMKTSDLFNRGARLMNSIEAEGLTVEHTDFAVSFVAQIRAFLRTVDLEDQDQIRTLLETMPMYDRAVATTMIAGLLALPLKVETESAFRAIGVAALLHDVGLIGLPTERYLEHPTRGAKLLADLPNIDPVSIQAVAQHHERRNNTGFPGRVRGSEINRIAELIGIADEFYNLLEKKKSDPSIDPLRIMDEKVFAGFSYPVIESFRTIFMK